MDEKGSIRFGTDGWRGVIAADFTFKNVRKLSAAIVRFLNERDLHGRPVVIGYDNRYLSELCACEAARCFLQEGIISVVSHCSVPTPALSLQVVQQSASLGIMITASHNPPEYNGLKLKSGSGASALPQITDLIQEYANAAEEPEMKTLPDPASIIRENFLSPYAEHIKNFIDIERIVHSRVKFIVDSMHGTGSRIIEEMISKGTCAVRTINAACDPFFGGTNPEPVEKNCALLMKMVRNEKYDAGAATDGDADRVAAVADDGSFISPLTLAPLLALHLIENKKKRGAIAKTCANTVYLDKIADAYSLPFFIRPIGFKYVSELMMEEDFLIGGEEAGGIGIGGYLPERDGILVALLLFEMICSTGRSLTELRSDMWKRFGRFMYRREDVKSAPDSGMKMTSVLSKDPPDRIAGYPVCSIDTLDGIKFLFRDGSWLLLRQSGTEAVLRVYAEASSRKMLDRLIEAGISLVYKNL